MILDAATGFGSLAVQLAHAWGAKVCMGCQGRHGVPRYAWGVKVGMGCQGMHGVPW